MKTPDARRVGWQLLVTALLAMAALGWPAASDAAPPRDWIPLDAGALQAMRGGFALPSGLRVSFGFERQAWVDGELVSSLRADVPDVARITAEQARDLARLQQVHVVQVGPDQAVAAGAGAGLVIQNSLAGTSIRVQTTLDASTNGLGLLQAMNFGEALGRAIAGSP